MPNTVPPVCPDVSIVVVNYNAGDLLLGCIEGCLQQAQEVILVDNASVDGSIEKVSQRFGENSRLKIIRNTTNLGFAAACNIGEKEAHGQFVLFLNPDCLMAENAVQELINALQANPKAGMAGGLLLHQNGKEQVGGRRAIPTPWRSFVRVFHLSKFADRWPRLFSDFNLHKQPLPEAPIEVEAISGSCMMVKRQAMQDIGHWDESYFLHCEDLDLCMRYRQKNWLILFVPASRIVHHQGTCSRKRPVFVEWHKHHGMMRFYRKHFRHQYPGLLMWLVGFGVWLRFCLVATHIKLWCLKAWLFGEKHET